MSTASASTRALQERLRRLSRRGATWGRLAAGVSLRFRLLRWRWQQRAPFSYKRAIDIALSSVLLTLASPILVPAMILIYAGGGRLERDARVGQHLHPIALLRFSTEGRLGGWFNKFGLRGLPLLLNILKGDLSFVGPRPLKREELDLTENAGRRRHTDRPGLLCLWWIRCRGSVDYGSEVDADAEYIDSFSLWRDLGIVLRAIPAALYGIQKPTAPPRVQLLGVPIDNVSMDEAVEQILTMMDGEQDPRQVCFANADCINIAFRDADYRRTLQAAGAVYADGIGMKLAGRLLKTGIKQNVNGTDLFPRLCSAMAGTGKRLFLLGAKPGVAERATEWIDRNYPGVEVCGSQHGYFEDDQRDAVVERIRASRADLLLVALGAPRQDVWLRDNLAATGAKVGIGVGGLFDFISGDVRRAPRWIREIGMEWFYRFLQEPGRMWRRYFIGNGIFLLRALREKAGGYGRAPQTATICNLIHNLEMTREEEV